MAGDMGTSYFYLVPKFKTESASLERGKLFVFFRNSNYSWFFKFASLIFFLNKKNYKI